MLKFYSPMHLARAVDKDYSCPPHLLDLNEKLQYVYKGDISRLMVNMPPRHGKSEMISKYFPAWLLTMNPSCRIMLASYEARFAEHWCRLAKQVYLRLHPKEKLVIDRGDYWETQSGGSLSACGMFGALTGKGADYLIIDDPIKNSLQAYSQTYRDRIYSWYISTAYTRLEPNGKIIIIQTRWHSDDLAGRIFQESDEDWTLLNMKAITNNNPLWAERYPLDVLLTKKKEIGSYWFSALYQQQPIASEYQIFKPSDWQFFTSIPQGTIIQSWDTAMKDKQMNDYSVCTTWCYSNNQFYLLDCFREKLLFPALEKTAKLLYAKWKPKMVVIEDQSSGTPLLQTLKDDTNIPLKAVKPKGDKVQRSHLVSPHWENKKVFILDGQGWTHDVIDEMARFPASAHDDIVDSCVYAVDYLATYGSIGKVSTRKAKDSIFVGY